MAGHCASNATANNAALGQLAGEFVWPDERPPLHEFVGILRALQHGQNIHTYSHFSIADVTWAGIGMCASAVFWKSALDAAVAIARNVQLSPCRHFRMRPNNIIIIINKNMHGWSEKMYSNQFAYHTAANEEKHTHSRFVMNIFMIFGCNRQTIRPKYRIAQRFIAGNKESDKKYTQPEFEVPNCQTKCPKIQQVWSIYIPECALLTDQNDATFHIRNYETSTLTRYGPRR